MTTHFFARLTGKREIPPVNTEAYGVAEFIFSEDLKKLQYRVILKTSKSYIMPNSSREIRSNWSNCFKFIGSAKARY